METNQSLFSRTALLIGRQSMDKLAVTSVALFGVGGVGSWCAESLIRSGIGNLSIVDADVINESNINRQLPATTETLGQSKVEVLKQRLQEINPSAQINIIQQFYDAESAGSFQLNKYDYIIDAIDSLESKALLIYNATQTKARFFSSMGAALKMDPARIKVAEFWKVKGCPLAAALRRKIKKNKMFPAGKFQCVFSDEILENKGTVDELTIKMNGGVTKRVNGTLVHITAVFGFTLASLVIQDICS